MNVRLLEIIKQQQIRWNIDDPITWDEFNRSINGLKNMKATWLNGVIPESFKAMDMDCRRCVLDLINDFWHKISDFESWHKYQCVPVRKS